MTRALRNSERSFGTSVGGVLCASAAFMFWRGRVYPAGITGGAGLLLLVTGLTVPRALALPSRLWWRLVRVLGYVNSRIILSILFVLLVVPLGLVFRMTGRDLLSRKRTTWRGWSPYPARYRDARHFERMY